MEKIFAVIKQMEADGVIGRYAIGGAIGSIFWIEPVTTKDVDVFVALPKSARDHDRVSRFLEQDALEIARFEAILTRHELTEKWREFQQRYCSDQP